MNKEQIKAILEKHLMMISKIADNEELMVGNPVLFQVVTDSMKTISITLLVIDKI